MAKENKQFIKGKSGVYKYCDNKISGVYIIINDATKEFYIGSSICVNTRLSHHFGDLKNNKHNCERLQDRYNKHGHDIFSFYVLYQGNEKFIREKESELLEDNHENPLLLNTVTINNNWVDERNGEKVSAYKKKLSEFAKTRTGNKNPFYGKHHSEESKEKLRQSNLGKNNSFCYKSVVINGKYYKSISEASEKLKVSSPTIIHRINNTNRLFVNWYYFDDVSEIKIMDDRLLFDERSKPSGLYEVEDKLYTETHDIMKCHNIKLTTLHYRFKSNSFPNWKKLI